MIKLNVGGKIFETTKQTIERISYFDALLSERWNDDEKNIFFIDRDPHIFKHILALLRDFRYPFPKEYAYELEFYGIEYEKKMEKKPIKEPFDLTELEKIIDICGQKFYNETINEVKKAMKEVKGVECKISLDSYLSKKTIEIKKAIINYIVKELNLEIIQDWRFIRIDCSWDLIVSIYRIE